MSGRFATAALPIAFLAAALAPSATLHAHEGDPKGLERRKPFVGPAWRLADGGVASDLFESYGVSLKAWFPANTFGAPGANSTGNDCWGYVSPSGREYAIMGLNGGTGFVDVTVPEESRIVAFQPGPTSLWRNVKTYRTWCYSVSEGGGGIQVFDLARIDEGIVTLANTVANAGEARTHTMIVNEERGFLYRMGGGSNGLRIYSLANPLAPTLVGEWQGRYVHDGFLVNYDSGPYAGKEIFFACGGLNGGFGQTGMTILDVTVKGAIVQLAHFQYPAAGFCHQAWITDDRRFVYINDETDEGQHGWLNVGRIVNVENLSAPFLAGTYSTGLVSVDHNLYVRGNLLFCSNYKTGLRIFDIASPTAPVEVAWFDTFPDADDTGYAGLWSNYPYLPSGTVIGSDIERGLFVWRVEMPVADFSFPGTLPSRLDPRGGETYEVVVAPRPGETIPPGGIRLRVSVDGGPWTESPLAPLGKGRYRAVFPAVPCGSRVRYQFLATSDTGGTTSAPQLPVEALAVLGVEDSFQDDFEADLGWSVGAPGDDATSGLWVRVAPVGTIAQPDQDNPLGTGTQCFVTGQGTPGGQSGAADVDGGSTTLTSPRLDASGLVEPRIEYARWYSNNLGAGANQDSMPILLSNDDGATWVQLELVTENLGAWRTMSWRIEDFLEPTDRMRVRFVARDLGAASLVEAAVDDVRISFYECPAALAGDLDGNGSVNAADLAILLGSWGASGSVADLDEDGTVTAADLTILVANWTG